MIICVPTTLQRVITRVTIKRRFVRARAFDSSDAQRSRGCIGFRIIFYPTRRYDVVGGYEMHGMRTPAVFGRKKKSFKRAFANES